MDPTTGDCSVSSLLVPDVPGSCSLQKPRVGFCDSTVDTEHRPPHPQRKGSQSQAISFSLSVVLQSLGVFTLNSRPWKRIYSLITGIKGNVSQGVVRLLLRLFQASESWLRLRRVVILFSLHLFLKFLFEDFLSCYLG